MLGEDRDVRPSAAGSQATYATARGRRSTTCSTTARFAPSRGGSSTTRSNGPSKPSRQHAVGGTALDDGGLQRGRLPRACWAAVRSASTATTPTPVGLPDEAGEDADARVEVEGPLPLPGRSRVHDRLDQHTWRLGVDLPEAVGGDGERVRRAADRDVVGDGVPGRARVALRSIGRVARASALRGDQAVVERRPAGGTGAPASPGGRPAARRSAAGCASAGRRRDAPRPGPPRPADPADQVGVGVEPTQPDELLADHGGLEVALGGHGGVLEVAAAAEAGACDGTGRGDPVRGRGQHLDGVSAPEAVAVRALGDLDDDPLARQRVSYEDHPRLGLGEPGDAVAAVGHRSDLGLEALPHPRATARARGAGWCGWSGSQIVDLSARLGRA